MLGPLIRALITMYGPSVVKTLIAAINKTLQQAGHNPMRDFQELVKPVVPKKMNSQEAKLILGATKGTPEEINRQFDKLFKMNDPANGGSLYLQCKLIAAKETLLKSSN
ncbi:hypothetical protein SteCoe_1045 [Stentor coeruleus]|uniref:Uncharacterized protein n=1 Tax=Stentor coeruleus TaxID=5963 RepID=A0A1R2D2W6_9CILI|nr:hypothetical protein SteCoe_1045 [Stentor coeruleus]